MCPIDDDDADGPGSYASPPCLMHEVDPVYMGLSAASDPQQISDVTRWRIAERERLIAARQAVDADMRSRHAARIADVLSEAIGNFQDLTVSFYWPIRGEPDLRDLMTRIVAQGGRTALPVVVRRAQPLVFRRWSPGEPLEAGFWNIPVPAAGEEVVPDIVVAPVVGFDRACFRLGYGGGYYDRTLAAIGGTPRLFAVGYALAEIATIYPQPHDMQMHAVVTEQGLITPADTAQACST